MMNTRFTNIALAALALSTAAFADDTAAFKKEYMASIPKTVAAFKNKDISYFEKMSTKDFTYVGKVEGTQDKKTAMAGLKQMFGMAKSVDYKPKVLKITAKGNAAVVSLEETFSSAIDMGDGKAHKMVAVGWADEHFRKEGGKWMLAKIVETKAGKMTLDGKPFDPAMMAPPPVKKAKSSKG
ncbi:MAG: nuclear transport factor 2 family protein [Armatimonadetes bacterium]|nr:nuclear transport factor 2 family protein [Armatimonadota bacterium]